jgi:hypothetical protein
LDLALCIVELHLRVAELDADRRLVADVELVRREPRDDVCLFFLKKKRKKAEKRATVRQPASNAVKKFISPR